MRLLTTAKTIISKTIRDWALPVAGEATSALAHPAAAYAASAVLHVVVLGGLAYYVAGDSDPAYSVGRGDGGLGSRVTPFGSAGGAPLTTVFHFELPPAPPVLQASSPAEAETSEDPVVAAAQPPQAAPLAPTQIDAIARRDPEGPTIEVDPAKLENRDPTPVTVAAQIEKAEEANDEKPELHERLEKRLPRREVAAAPPTEGDARVEVPELVEANGRGVAGAGSGGGQGEGNGGASGLAGGDFESMARLGPRNPSPVYPPEARAAGLEGRVFLRVQISAQGAVKQVRVERSSGWQILDDAALKAVSVWRFDPARRAGLPVDSEVLVPIHFHIDRS